MLEHCPDCENNSFTGCGVCCDTYADHIPLDRARELIARGIVLALEQTLPVGSYSEAERLAGEIADRLLAEEGKP